MKIQWKKKEPKTVPFGSLTLGDVFVWPEVNDDQVYLTIQDGIRNTAVNLLSGKSVGMSPSDLVTPLAATLVVEEAT